MVFTTSVYMFSPDIFSLLSLSTVVDVCYLPVLLATCTTHVFRLSVQLLTGTAFNNGDFCLFKKLFFACNFV